MLLLLLLSLTLLLGALRRAVRRGLHQPRLRALLEGPLEEGRQREDMA